MALRFVLGISLNLLLLEHFQSHSLLDLLLLQLHLLLDLLDYRWVGLASFLELGDVCFQGLYFLGFDNDLLLGHLEHVLEFLNRKLLVDSSLVFDLFGTLAEPERGNRLVFIENTGTTSDDQTRFRVTAETLLEDSGEFRISVWDMRRFAIGEGIDDLAQAGQTFVDVFGFIKSLALGTGFGDSLGTCQINKINLTRLGRKVDGILLLDLQNENTVRPR